MEGCAAGQWVLEKDDDYQFVADNDSTVYVDTAVAASISAPSGKPPSRALVENRVGLLFQR